MRTNRVILKSAIFLSLQGLEQTEQLAQESSAQVSDIVDTDRTAELLVWLWDSLFNRKGKKDGNGESMSMKQVGTSAALD